jgi:hypothetical protein
MQQMQRGALVMHWDNKCSLGYRTLSALTHVVLPALLAPAFTRLAILTRAGKYGEIGSIVLPLILAFGRYAV